MKIFLFSLVVILVTSRPAAAQSPQQSWGNLSQLKAGQKIEVVDMKYKSLKGEFIVFSDDEISFKTDKGGVSMLRGEVRTVKNREKNRRAQRGLIVGLLGALGGAAAGALITSSVADSSEVSYGASGGFFIGLGAGAALGAAMPSPVTIYQVPEAPVTRRP